MAHYKGVYKDMQEKAQQLNIMRFFMKSSGSLYIITQV
jgi:hypothetical protein